MEPFSLPESLKLGAGTSAFQIEGGSRNNSWYRWSHLPGKIADGTDCSRASNHWNKVDEDIVLLKRLNISTYRFSIEWARIEPEKDRFDYSAMDHYRDEIIKIKKAGIEPLVTLHHFSNPLWVEDSIGWTSKKIIKRFEKYTRFVVEQLGEHVDLWLTINEPSAYLYFGYIKGTWPPGKKFPPLFFKGARNIIGAHIAAYNTIHNIRTKMGFAGTRVGAAHHLRIFDPVRENPLDKTAAFMADYYMNRLTVEGFHTGKVHFPAGIGYPFGKGIFQDFLGINYYSRDMLSFRGRELLSVAPGSKVNHLGWEIYPVGLRRICREYAERYHVPIFITENGTCDNDDSFRSRFIYDHLSVLSELIEEGINIERYYHWSFMDNFELTEGLSGRFGLVHIDYETQKRTIKKSGSFYSEIARSGKITRSMITRYLDEKPY
jgi:beta-glucosidase